jgi:hypothetical protein
VYPILRRATKDLSTRSGLHANAKEELSDIIESRPVAYGLNIGVWTSKIIAKALYLLRSTEEVPLMLLPASLLFVRYANLFRLRVQLEGVTPSQD